MGKTIRWFRALLGSKKSLNSLPETSGSDSRSAKEKKKWGSARSLDSNEHSIGGTRGSSTEASTSSRTYVEAADASKHAIAVAAATAAVAEAALAAAQAAAEVVRLTSGGSRPATAYVNGSDRRRELAALKIQSAFRAYLARRALRALKGLVKLQALVRGRIVRKQSADMLRRMQAMARIQARACANRAYVSEYSYSSSKSSQPLHPSLAIPKRYNHQNRAYNTKFDGSTNLKKTGTKSKIKDNINLERTHLDSNWFDRWMEECSWNRHKDTSYKTAGPDDDKILEVDTWKPHLNSQRSNRSFQTLKHVSSRNNNDQGLTTRDSLPRHLMNSQKPLNPSLSSGEVLSLKSLNYLPEGDEFAVWTSENSPQVYSALSRPGSSSRGVGPFTPARSECSRSFFGGYPGHPNYMANTESSRAKFRSQSAPRQRIQFENPGSTKRFVRGLWDVDTISERGLDLHANSRSKAYPGS